MRCRSLTPCSPTRSEEQARRRILEEAAGITGLHTRRHEAELKLKAAETNLERLEDVLAQLENQLQSLKRQARQAVRYKELSSEIRRLEATGLYLAWKDARAAVEAENTALSGLTRVLGEQTRAVSEMTRMRDQASETLPKLRETEAVRAAVLQRITLEREGLEREEKQSLERRAEIEGRIEQINRDLAREKELLGDTDGVMKRLADEQATLEAAAGNDGEARAAAAKTLQAEAEKLAEVDASLKKTSALIEKGNLEKAKQRRPELLQGYTQLELAALKQGTAELAKSAIASAKKQGAEKYAPKTLAQSEEKMALAVSILDADRTQTEKAEVQAKNANSQRLRPP